MVERLRNGLCHGLRASVAHARVLGFDFLDGLRGFLWGPNLTDPMGFCRLY
jgi:hypothetical protein